MSRVAAVWRVMGRHRLFSVTLAVGFGLRLVTMLGFPPAIWFGGDSASYLSTALRHVPGTSRLSGYGVMLLALRPFHSFAAVTAVQHLLGLAIATAMYALLRRHGLPSWGAVLATVPVLASAYQLELEQEILPSAAFGFLVMAGVTLAVWWRGAGPAWATVTAGALLAVSATFWPVGLPVLILFGLRAVLRRPGWRVLAATTAAAALPLAGYVLWFDHTYHRVAFTSSDGIFLWSRTMTFADCGVIRPPAAERPLCPRGQPAARPAASTFIWEPGSPLGNLPGKKFSPAKNALALDFALHAIAAQPGGYATAVLRDFALSFAWDIPAHPSAQMTRRYEFRYATTPWISPGYVVVPGHTARSDQLAYGGEYGTRAVPPFAGWLEDYQRYAYLRGTLLAVILLTGLAGVIWPLLSRRRSRPGPRAPGPALFPWLVSLALLLVPVMTADYSERYVLIAIPPACLAAGLAFARVPSPEGTPGPDGDPAEGTWSPLPAASPRHARVSSHRR